jgi:hypothetical protein
MARWARGRLAERSRVQSHMLPDLSVNLTSKY